MQQVTKALELVSAAGFPEELRRQGVPTVVTDITQDKRIIVSPALAQWFLEQGHPNQRSVPATDVSYYEERMLAQRFVEYAQPGIYMNRRGQECNAQTRLTAQARCGVTLGWMLRLGATDEEIAVLDDTRRRRANQTLGLLERPMSSREGSVFKAYERLLRSVDLISPTNVRMGPQALDALRDDWGRDVTWACEQWPDRVAPASMVAALAYARPVMPASIESFATSYAKARLALGAVTGGANAPAVVLARYMNGAKSGAGAAAVLELMNRCLSALRAHAEGRETKHLYGDRETAKPLRFFKEARRAAGLSG